MRTKSIRGSDRVKLIPACLATYNEGLEKSDEAWKLKRCYYLLDSRKPKLYLSYGCVRVVCAWADSNEGGGGGAGVHPGESQVASI